MKVLTDDVGTNHYNALIYGPPGSGKTSFGCTAPEPILVLLTELNAVPHIRGAAKRLGRVSPEIVYVERASELNDVLTQLYGDPSKPFVIGGKTMARPRSVVVDQVSDLGRLLSAEHDKKYPPREGKDGLPTRAMNSWNRFGDQFRAFIKAFRDAPCHTIFVAEYVDKSVGEEGEERVRYVGPVMPMKAMVSAIVHAVSVVGITYRTYTSKTDAQGNRVIDYGVNLHGPQHQVTKILRPLNDREVPDFSSWVRRLDGAIEDVRLPEPPDEMKEGLKLPPSSEVNETSETSEVQQQNGGQ